MKDTLHKQIMRRVYYAYAIRIALHPAVTHGALVLFCALLLTHFVSFPNVIANMLNKKVSEVHLFLFESAQSTEIWTMLLLGAMLLTGISFYIQISTRHRTHDVEVAYGR